jgi:hypothetical protein
MTEIEEVAETIWKQLPYDKRIVYKRLSAETVSKLLCAAYNLENETPNIKAGVTQILINKIQAFKEYKTPSMFKHIPFYPRKTV